MIRNATLFGFFLLVLPSMAASQVLNIDIDDRGAADPANTMPGFEQFLIGGRENDDNTTATTRTFGSINVTINHSNGGAYGDRRRAQPTNNGDFTDQEILRDFIFARGTSPEDGLDIRIDSLTPGLDYNVKIWSFDEGSRPARTSDWTANGVLVKDDYTFDGAVLPTDNLTNSFEFVSTADGSGEILIEGRYVSGACCAVFLNGLSISAVPEPSSMALAMFGGIGILGIARRQKK